MSRLKPGATGGLIFLGGICAVTIFNAIRSLPTDPKQGIGELVTVGVALALTFFLAYVVWWVRSESVRGRRETLHDSLGPSHLWVADVNLEPSGDAQGESIDDAKNFSLLVTNTSIEMWLTASDGSPALTIERDRILEVLPDPGGAPGGFVMRLRVPFAEVVGTIVGPFWGGLQGSKTDVDRLAKRVIGDATDAARGRQLGS